MQFCSQCIYMGLTFGSMLGIKSGLSRAECARCLKCRLKTLDNRGLYPLWIRWKVMCSGLLLKQGCMVTCVPLTCSSLPVALESENYSSSSAFLYALSLKVFLQLGITGADWASEDHSCFCMLEVPHNTLHC